MNIFSLDKDPKRAAESQCDSHVCKMIVELAQMMCGAHILIDGAVSPRLYKLTHKNHPCTVWVCSALGNYQWAYKHFAALCKEYTFRYGRQHKTERELLSLLARPPKNIPDRKLMPFLKSVEVYRYYYREKYNTIKMRYTRRPPPKFFDKLFERTWKNGMPVFLPTALKT